jgi:hypothetical protein
MYGKPGLANLHAAPHELLEKIPLWLVAIREDCC